MVPPTSAQFSQPSESPAAPGPAVPPLRLVIDDPDLPALRRFVKGDRAALGELAASYEHPLIGLATSLLSRREDLAMEAVQDTWVRVITSAKHFAARSSVKTWLYRILINRCNDLRKARVLAATGAPATPTSHRESPQQAVDAVAAKPAPAAPAESLTPLRAALESLSAERRLLLILCYHAGMTHPQAADVLGIPVGTLKSRLAAALDELRKLLKEPTP